MFRNNKAFTLIEVLAVIIIIGILLMIAVPNYAEHVINSKRNAYSDTIKAYIESAKALVYEKHFGSYPDDGEVLVIPIQNIEVEQNKNLKSPYGEFNLNKSYIVVVPRKTTGANPVNVYDYYATVIDKTNMGVINKSLDSIVGKSIINVGNTSGVAGIDELKANVATLIYNGLSYELCSDRTTSLLLCEI